MTAEYLEFVQVVCGNERETIKILLDDHIWCPQSVVTGIVSIPALLFRAGI